MDQQLGDAEPGYVSCMFCTARCFKLHGTSQGACAAASTSSREMVLNQPGALKERSSGRKHRAPFFVKTVKITTVRRKNCELHLPAFFFKDYGDRFQKFVLLQGPSGQVWPVNLCVSCGSTTGRPTVRFSRGWKEFANDHRLELGDKLIFTLASFSRFSVQVFDPLGRKKPTSSTAVSGWSFRREEDDDSGSRPQKKSIFVNWQNKVVRESSLGSSLKNGKGQASRVAMLCRHLKRDNKTPEKRSSSLIARLRGQSLPLSLLGQKWSNRDEVLDDTQADDATNLLEWEPLETASPSQLWPLALKSNHSSKALDSVPQGAKVLSITSNSSSPPREGDREEDDEEDPFQAYWKLHNKRSAISEVAPWPTAETPQIRNERPVSTPEVPKAIDIHPSPTLISISHCLAPVSRSETAPQPCSFQSSVSQELLGFATLSSKQESVKPEKLSHRISDSEVREAQKNIPSNVQSSVSQELLGFPNSFLKQESVKHEQLPQRNRLSEAEKSIPSNLQSSVTQELLGFANSSSVRIEKLSQRNLEEAADPSRVEAEIIDRAPSARSELEIKPSSRSFANPAPSRSDLSLTYFLHQPKPTAQKHGDGVSGDLPRLQKPHPVSAQKVQAPDTRRIKPQVQCPSLASSKENIPPGPLVVYKSSQKLDKVTLPCKRSGTLMEKKSRPRISDCNRGLSQAVSSSRRDVADKFQLDSASKKRSLEVNSGVVLSEDHLNVRKLNLGGALNLLGQGSTPQTKIGTSGNRCDLVELDDIASDDDGSDS